jgi:hypothetical protein
MNIVICKGYFICERPGTPALFARDGTLLPPKYGDWDHVFWGVPGQKLGRLPMALHIANKFHASRLIFTIGSARLETGQTEAEWIREYVASCYHRLVEDFPKHFKSGRFSSEAHFLAWIKALSVFEDQGHNTQTDLRSVPDLIGDASGEEIGMIFVVSSGNHSPRTDRDGQIAFGKSGIDSRFALAFVPAETCYGGKRVEDVVIHDLGDSDHVPWARS